MLILEKLNQKWRNESIDDFHPTDIYTLQKFETDNNVVLPGDLKEYFKFLNGTGNECTNELYEFYSINRINKVAEEFKDWKGIPTYQFLSDSCEVKDLFVFANFSFNLFAYAIRLRQELSSENEVYVLCGQEYKRIAYSFSEFLELYLADSTKLQFV